MANIETPLAGLGGGRTGGAYDFNTQDLANKLLAAGLSDKELLPVEFEIVENSDVSPAPFAAIGIVLPGIGTVVAGAFAAAGLWKRTSERKQVARLTEQVVQDHLFRVARTMDHALTVFGDNKRALTWLRQKNTSLDGARPIDLLKSDAGTYGVQEALHRIDFGIYA